MSNPRPILVLTQSHLSLVALYANGKSLREISSLTMVSYTTVRRRLDEAKLLTGSETLSQLIARCVDDGAIMRDTQGFRPTVDPTSLE